MKGSVAFSSPEPGTYIHFNAISYKGKNKTLKEKTLHSYLIHVSINPHDNLQPG